MSIHGRGEGTSPNLEDCAHCAVRGLDLRSGRVTVIRY